MFDNEIEKLLYSKVLDKRVVAFEQILPPCKILQLLTIEDIYQLNKIARSKKYAAKPKEKFAMIDQIMQRRGFKKLAAGTNRIVYKYLEDQSFVIKVAHCKVALTDNIQEMNNQNVLAPFVSKCFEVSPCGTVGMFERVSPISNRQQFLSIASDIYDIIINHFLGRFVLDDFGSKYFMNWGVRQGAFPVLLDYPYVYKLDGAKLICNKPDPYSETGYCGGDIDYDDGFNHLFCTKCGKNYFASDLKERQDKSQPSILVETKGDIKMNVMVMRGDTVISSVDTTKETAVYEKTKSGKPQGYGLAKRERNRKPEMNVMVTRVKEEPVEPEVDENQIPKNPDMHVAVIQKGAGRLKAKNTEKFISDVNTERNQEDEPVNEEVKEPVTVGFNIGDEELESRWEDATEGAVDVIDPEYEEQLKKGLDYEEEDQPAVKGSDVVEIVDDRETAPAEDSNNIDEY